MIKNNQNQPKTIQKMENNMTKGLKDKIQKMVPANMDDQPLVMAPLIDKLSVVINVLDDKLLGQINHELLSMLEAKEDGYTRKSSSARFPLAVAIQCPDEDGVFDKQSPSILMQVSSKNSPTP